MILQSSNYHECGNDSLFESGTHKENLQNCWNGEDPWLHWPTTILTGGGRATHEYLGDIIAVSQLFEKDILVSSNR